MSEEKTMTKDTRAIIIAIVMAVVAIIGVNKADISELRADMRELRTDLQDLQGEVHELRGLLLAHIGGHSHSGKVADAGSEADGR